MRAPFFTTFGFLAAYFIYLLTKALFGKANDGEIEWGTLGMIGSAVIIGIFVVMLIQSSREVPDKDDNQD